MCKTAALEVAPHATLLRKVRPDLYHPRRHHRSLRRLVTIDGNRFDAQERFNGQFFELIHQRLNAQEALISERLDAQDELISERLDAQDRLINQRFDAQDQRLDDHAKRLDRLTDEVSELRRLMVSVSERVSRNEGEIDVIREQLRIADTPSP